MIARVPGARIWYEDEGSGAPLVLLHAGSGNSALWVHQLEAFAAAGYRCIAYDRRGHGKTEVEPRAEPVAASQDLNLLVQELGLDAIHLLGTAAGGIVAFDFALSHPHRVKNLVVANSIGGVQDEDYLTLQRRLRPAPQFDALPVELRELGPAYRAANAPGVARWLELHGAQVLQKTRMANRISWSSLATISAPTLLVTGDADLYCPPPVMELFRKSIPGAKSVVIEGCGHSAFWESPERFNRAVLQFLSGGAASN